MSVALRNILSHINLAVVGLPHLVRYKIIPIFLNVLLAWLKSFVTNLPFAGILGFTFAAGMFLFMLPPAPGHKNSISILYKFLESHTIRTITYLI